MYVQAWHGLSSKHTTLSHDWFSAAILANITPKITLYLVLLTWVTTCAAVNHVDMVVKACAGIYESQCLCGCFIKFKCLADVLDSVTPIITFFFIKVPSFGRFYNLAQILIKHSIFLTQ